MPTAAQPVSVERRCSTSHALYQRLAGQVVAEHVLLAAEHDVVLDEPCCSA